ncbi:MAG TPA: MFS transporter [Candidatus Sulfotelmatobacter sp.]|nr:MFS transporter [Candidatus Sulfotelmatobacter sp.]
MSDPQSARQDGRQTSNARWIICGLLFLAAAVNYSDRQVIGILKPTLQSQLHWSEIDYGHIIAAFQLAYALGYLLVGRLMDRIGSYRGFSFAVVFWSLAEMAHAFARSVTGFGVARAALGIGEGGSFPASMKTVADWFPPKERALATGIFNAGTNIGAVVAPLTVPWITLVYGWRWAFLATGAVGFVWVTLWLVVYRFAERRVTSGELPGELVHVSGGSAEAVRGASWVQLLGRKQVWAIAIGKFLTDPVWFIYLFWIPDFLHKTRGLGLLNLGMPLVVIYVAADVGSVGGGWLSGALIRRGWPVITARESTMFICACGVLPILFAVHASSLRMAVGLVGLAAACHQGWSANIYTLVSDMFPRQEVGSVVGIAGMAGAGASILIAEVVGYILQTTGSYYSIFAIASGTYLLALGVIHLMVGQQDASTTAL